MRHHRLQVEKPSWDATGRPGSSEPSATPPVAPPKREPSVRLAILSMWFALSRRFRARRALRFRSEFQLTADTRILDLGGGDGEHIRMVLETTPVRLENVYVADVNEKALGRARAHGHPTAVLAQDGTVPFPDGFFDVVFCSSVIEHVTVPKNELWQHRDRRFARRGGGASTRVCR